MAEFTKLDDEAVAAIAGLFGIDGITGWRPIAAGTINSNFALETAEARYFLRVNEGKTAEDVRYESSVLEALIERGVPTPLPLEAAPGHRYSTWQDRFVNVFPWIDGHHRELGQVTAEDAGAVGVALAELHLAGAPLAASFERRGIYTFDQIAERLAGIAAHPDPHLADYARELAAEVAWLSDRAKARTMAPSGVIHGDLFRDNVLFRPGGAPVLLDFEQASVGSFAYDLAVCINAWCFVEDFDPALVRAMVHGYCGKRPLGDPERRILWTELRAAAMRFTVTRITDIYLPGLSAPGKEFERYFRRLVAWRTLGEDGLTALLA